MFRTLLVAALLVPAIASAQSAVPDFRAGQWAAEAAVGDGLSASVLRFRSPTSAWRVGADVNVARTHAETESSFPQGDSESDATNVDLGLRLGLRRYAAGTAALRPLNGVGLLGSITRNEVSAFTDQRWSAGAYGELGAVYRFGEHVSLGGAAELSVQYRSVRQENAGTTQRSTGVAIGAQAVRLLGAVYF